MESIKADVPQPSNRATEERNKTRSSILTLLMGFVYEKILHSSYAFLYAVTCFFSKKKRKRINVVHKLDRGNFQVRRPCCV